MLGLLPVAHDDAVEELGRDGVRQAARRVKVDKLGAHVVAHRVEFEHEAERPDDEVDEGEAEREHETEDEHVKQLVQI